MTSRPATEIIHIIYTDEDVIELADSFEPPIPHDVALERAHEWGKHIESTASTLCGEQLASVIAHNAP